MYFFHNTQLKYIEKGKQFKHLKAELERLFYHQWEDVITSGIINEVEELIKKKHLPVKTMGKIRKAVKQEEVLPINDEGVTELKHRKALYAAILLLVKKYLKQGRKYFDIVATLKKSLKYFATKGGQQILDQISDATNTRPKTFFLENKAEIKKLDDRADGLVPSLDKTTEKELAKAILSSFEKEKTKKQVIQNLLKVGLTLAALRAARVAITEAASAYEHTRQVTSKLNGVETKTWLTANDDKTCDVCGGNNFQTVGIDEPFSSGVDSTPQHVRCRCTISYGIGSIDIDTGEYSKSFNPNPHAHYKTGDVKKSLQLINPNALWIGGTSLVGSDRSIGALAMRLNLTLAAKSLLNEDFYGTMYLDKIVKEWKDAYMESKTDTVSSLSALYTEDEVVLIEARFELTQLGFIQLLLVKGYNMLDNDAVYKMYDALPYDDIQRRYAQHMVYDLSLEGRYNLSNTSISIDLQQYNVDYSLYETKEIPVKSISANIGMVDVQRLISVMDNFREAQRRAGDAINVVERGEGVYTMVGDGLHRFVAAHQLGIETINANIYQLVK